ncbi:helix-turn-helix transcriptional regulator [Rhizobium laguerreae]|uniref:Helix-turn-helix transcriptional regulator n=1 Tax=Rhizobium laguerreae TaxID=1076926 RepID=A0AB35FP43_9HYPH|nr:helix-turn-helix transcriptional regulator [Rhizobium laguerreae]MBY3068291.1 helix-turn-helix transcriptional regulator [Rhizobium laguerreae]
MSTAEINPGRLVALRSKQGLSQKQLASKINVDKGTISRWERGEVTRLRADKLGMLCKALHTSETEICAEGPLPERAADQEVSSRGQVNLMMDTACRNALGLVALRYGITRQQIVEIAPLLFFVLAEEGLSHRRQALQGMRDQMDKALELCASHLKSQIRGIDNGHDEELLADEDASITARDLFASKVGGWRDGRATENPFAKHLSFRLANTGAAPNSVVSWEADEAPSFTICIEEAEKLLGPDQNACSTVLTGKVALSEMPAHVRRGSPESRASWVRDQANMNDRELRELFQSLNLEDLSFDPLPQNLGITDAGENHAL